MISNNFGTKFGPANNKSLREFLFFILAEQSKHLLKGVVSDCFLRRTAGIKWPTVISILSLGTGSIKFNSLSLRHHFAKSYLVS